MRTLVLGTAGHIDHGKSALVRALTGTDPDRLKEEQLRGITIELGFADLSLNDERRISFVDVPGHERFVRHMVAGATGIDAVVLVVAADQGVQPQTREHLEICRLLDVRTGLVALTKSDLVDADLAQVVALEIEELVEGSFLEGSPVLPVSARTGDGLDALREALRTLFDEVEARPTRGVARLPVDRSFVMRGFGTVVTGTLASGTLAVGDEVVLLPGDARGRIRGLQTHGATAERIEAGHRTALNLQGVDRESAARGNTLTHAGALGTTRRFWARVTLLPTAPESLRRGGPVRVHQGTDDAAGRLRVLETLEDDRLAAELYLDEAMVLAVGDRFILRRPAPLDTLGGGVVTEVDPPRARHRQAGDFAADATSVSGWIRRRLERSGLSGCDAVTLARELGRTSDEVGAVLREADEAGKAVCAAGIWFDAARWKTVVTDASASVERFHEEQPLARGIERESLRSQVAGSMPQESWRELLEGAAALGHVQLDGHRVASAGHRIELDPDQQRRAEKIEQAFLERGLDPPAPEEVEELDPERDADLLEWLVDSGALVRIQDRRLFHRDALAALRLKLRRFARDHRTIDVAGFKELAGVTRRNAIPLLEQLDAERATRRSGNEREILLEPD